MKKIVSVLLILVLCLTLFSILGACYSNYSKSNKGSSNSTKSDTTDSTDKIENVVKSYAGSHVRLTYGATMTNFTCNIHSWISNTSSPDEITGYNVAGKVTCKDKYGDFYSGNYDAVVGYNSETDTYSVKSFKLQTPTKN